jgi:hypothetical protein
VQLLRALIFQELDRAGSFLKWHSVKTIQFSFSEQWDDGIERHSIFQKKGMG